jgi:hypothetical protein
MLSALTNVRFWGQSGHGPTAAYQSRFMSTRSKKLPPELPPALIAEMHATARKAAIFLK